MAEPPRDFGRREGDRRERSRWSGADLDRVFSDPVERANEYLLQKIGDLTVRAQRRAQRSEYVRRVPIVEQRDRARVARLERFDQSGFVADELERGDHAGFGFAQCPPIGRVVLVKTRGRYFCWVRTDREGNLG